MLIETRVEHIAGSLNVASELNFTELSASIGSVIEASQSLDVKKTAALQKLRKLLPKVKRPKRGFTGRIKHAMWKVRAKCGSKKAQEILKQMDRWREPGTEELLKGGEHHSKPSPPLKNIKEIRKVLVEIRGINHKLKGFEGGFISEEGIKVGHPSPVAHWNVLTVYIGKRVVQT